MPYRTLHSLPSSFIDLPSVCLSFAHSAPATLSACMSIRQVGKLLLRHFSHLLFFICAGKSFFLKWPHGWVPQLFQVFAHRSLLFKFPSSTYSPSPLPASSSPCFLLSLGEWRQVVGRDEKKGMKRGEKWITTRGSTQRTPRPNISTCVLHILCSRYNSMLQMRKLRLERLENFPRSFMYQGGRVFAQ